MFPATMQSSSVLCCGLLDLSSKSQIGLLFPFSDFVVQRRGLGLLWQVSLGIALLSTGTK